MPIITRVPDITIPDVSNLSTTKAESQLRKAGFEVATDTKNVSSDTINEGKVVKTDPSIGRIVKKGTVITLYISTGISYVEIGDYVGENFVDVKTELALKGIEVIQEKKVVDNVLEYRDKEDIIIDQSVTPGTKLQEGDEITLYLPDVYDVYPDMVAEQWLLSDVQKFADDYQLVLTVEEQVNDDLPEGRVISQNRGANTKVVSGSNFKVVVAKPSSTTEENQNQEDTTEGQ
jgi:serine/threonine-protein kinase